MSKEEPEYIAADYIEEKEWQQDPAGYLLIRLKGDNIEVGLVKAGNQPHQIEQVVYGKTATEIYMTIYKSDWNLREDHMAYLGKELARAEFALKYKKEYVQDSG